MTTNKNAKLPAAGGRLLQFRQNISNGTEYFYSDLDGVLLASAIDCVTRHGAAIMFGRTSEGGAYSVLILDGNEKVKEYKHSPADMADLLRQIVATYSDD